MDKSVFDDQIERVKNIERNFGNFEDYVLLSTFGARKHRLIVEEAYANSCHEMKQVYQDLHPLELADLYDAQNMIGRFDGEFD